MKSVFLFSLFAKNKGNSGNHRVTLVVGRESTQLRPGTILLGSFAISNLENSFAGFLKGLFRLLGLSDRIGV